MHTYESVIEKVLKKKLIVILRGISDESLLPAAEALARGGVEMFEVTFDAAGGREAVLHTARQISMLCDHFGDRAQIGAGTVLTPDEAAEAAAAGARYMISPDCNAAVIERTRALGCVSMPGAFTPTEAQTAHIHGADFVKIFPAVTVGPTYFKQVIAPMSHIRFLAVGGIDASNASSFLAAGAVGLGVGGALADKKAIAAGDFTLLTSKASAFCHAIG